MNYVHVEHNCQSEPDPYLELALGIIRQAAADYRYLRQHYSADLCDEDKKRIRKEIRAIRRFFLSRWYIILSGIENGPKILEMLDSEVLSND